MAESDRLLLCPSCRRHVAARESACPFCACALDPSKPLGPILRGATLAAAVTAIGIATAACGDAPAMPQTPTAPAADPTMPTAPTSPIAITPDAGAPVREPAAIYGGPPPR